MTFRTLPIKRYGVIGGQDVNIVDPAALKAIVRAAFYPAPRSRHAPGSGHAGHQPPAVRAGATTVDVLNGGSTAGLAGRVSAAVTSAGYGRPGREHELPHQLGGPVRPGRGGERARRQRGRPGRRRFRQAALAAGSHSHDRTAGRSGARIVRHSLRELALVTVSRNRPIECPVVEVGCCLHPSRAA